jgi:hypothetical protein
MLFDQIHSALGAFARTVLHHFGVHRAGVLHRVFHVHVVHAVVMLRRFAACHTGENARAKRQNCDHDPTCLFHFPTFRLFVFRSANFLVNASR